MVVQHVIAAGKPRFLNFERFHSDAPMEDWHTGLCGWHSFQLTLCVGFELRFQMGIQIISE